MEFNKFFHDGEGLVLKSKTDSIWSVYFIFILILLAFFLVFPMLRAGRQGLFLWLSFTLLLFALFLQKNSRSKNIYLLTNHRILHFQKQGFSEYFLLKKIKYSSIRKISKKGKYSLEVTTSKNKYMLRGLRNRDIFFKTLKTYLSGSNML